MKARIRNLFLGIFVLFINQSLGEINLVVLHTSDMNGKFQEIFPSTANCAKETGKDQPCIGGIARVLHFIKYHRELSKNGKIPPMLYFLSGNLFAADIWARVFGAEVGIKFINLLAPDAMVLGPSEFAMDRKIFENYISNVKAPILATNLKTDDPIAKKFKKSIILDVGGVKVGVIGNLFSIKKGHKKKWFENFETLPVTEATNAESDKLKKQGAKIIIVIGSTSFQEEQHAAFMSNYVDLFLGGGVNTFMYNGPSPDPYCDPFSSYPWYEVSNRGRRIPIAHSYAFTKFVSYIFMRFDDNGDLIEFKGQPVYLSESIAQDKEALDLLEDCRPRLDMEYQRTFAKLNVLLEGDDLVCTKRECNFGNLLADSLIYFSILWHPYSKPGWTLSSIALIVGESIRRSTDVSGQDGNLTINALKTAYPLESEIILFSIKGKDFREGMEHVFDDHVDDDTKRPFLQVSGIRLIVDQSNLPGSRILSFKVRCAQCDLPIYEDLVDGRTYNIVSHQMLLHRTIPKLRLLQNTLTLTPTPMYTVDTSNFFKYVSKEGIITNGIEGRVQILDKGNSSPYLNNIVSSRSLITIAAMFLLSM